MFLLPGHYVAIKASYKMGAAANIKKPTKKEKAELLNEVKDVYEGFLHSCLNWVGGDDGTY